MTHKKYHLYCTSKLCHSIRTFLNIVTNKNGGRTFSFCLQITWSGLAKLKEVSAHTHPISTSSKYFHTLDCKSLPPNDTILRIQGSSKYTSWKEVFWLSGFTLVLPGNEVGKLLNLSMKIFLSMFSSCLYPLLLNLSVIFPVLPEIGFDACMACRSKTIALIFCSSPLFLWRKKLDWLEEFEIDSQINSINFCDWWNVCNETQVMTSYG